MTRASALVVGLGQPDRGDDAVGAVVAERIAHTYGDEVQVVTREDPTALVQLWDGWRVAVIIDAVCSGRVPGTVRVMEAGEEQRPLSTQAFTAAGRGGSHAFGLAGAIELARTLGTLPTRVAIVGIEAGTFAYGHLSTPVKDNIDRAVATVVDVLAQEGIEVPTCVSEPSPR